MNKENYQSRLEKIQKEALKLNNKLHTLNALAGAEKKEYFLDAAVKSEKLACAIRHLVTDSGIADKDYILNRAIDAQNITIKESKSGYCITIPRLLPKWKQKRSADFIVEPLHFTLEQFSSATKPLKLEKCCICYIHIYEQNTHMQAIRDYDNLQLKHIQDVIANFLLIDDSGFYCDTYQTTEFGPKDCTKIFIMPQDNFPSFVINRKLEQNFISNYSQKEPANFR